MSIHPAAKYDSALVISDSHVGLTDKEVFREDFEDFVGYLASHVSLSIETDAGSLQIERPKVIILLGDFMDLWDGRLWKLPPFVVDYARVLAGVADVFYLRGNHDYIIPDIESESTASGKRFEICENLFLELGGRACFFIHGHQFMSAFGPISLKIESFINPYYTTLESFFSRLTFKHGREVLFALTGVFLLLGALSGIAPAYVSSLGSGGMLLSGLFGILLPVGVVVLWRVLQKPLWRLIMRVFGDTLKLLRGAVRGDTIEYLTSDSKPISRWFMQKGTDRDEARQSGFVCFGHTHIPEGPSPGNSSDLRQISFLNTGSWVKPPSERLQSFSTMVRGYTRPLDKIDEYVAVAAIILLLVLGFSTLSVWTPAIVIIGLALLVFEAFMTLGKSSYRRLPSVGVRSLAFIGKDPTGSWRAELLYWDPSKELLRTTLAES